MNIIQCIECGCTFGDPEVEVCLCGGEVIKATAHKQRMPDFTRDQREIERVMRSNRGLEYAAAE